MVGVDVYSDEKEKDSVKVAEAGKRFFEEGGKNLIIIDTAGRHKEEQSLLDEMSRSSRRSSPTSTCSWSTGRSASRPSTRRRPSTRPPRWAG